MMAVFSCGHNFRMALIIDSSNRLRHCMVELMVQNTSKFISKIISVPCVFEIKLKLVSNCFFASIKRYIKEELSLIKK